MKILFLLFLFLTSTLNAQVKFAVFGDYGCDEPAELAVSILVKSWNPDFIVTSGDNNYYQSNDGDSIDHNIGKYYHEYIKPYLGSYGSGSAPVNRFFPAMGNHDFYDYLWFGPNDIRYSGRNYYHYFWLTDTSVHKGNTPDQWSPLGVRYYTFRKGNVQFFIVNSGESPDNHQAHLYSERDGIDSNSVQGQWFKTQLSNSTATWKIVVLHHPPYSSIQLGLENHFKDLRWNFKQWGASAVISGHNHLYESLIINGLPYFISGLGGEDKIDTILPGHPGSRIQYFEKFGSMLCVAYNDSLIFKFINVDNEIIDYYKLVTLQNDAGVNMTEVANSEILYAGGTYCFNAQVKNFGSNDLFFVPVQYTVNGGSPVGPVSTGAVNSGDSALVSLCEGQSFTPPAAGNYTLKFFTNLAGDTVNTNDTNTLVLTVIDSSKDVGVINANSFPVIVYKESPVSFSAIVKNFGVANLPSVMVSYSVNDSTPVTMMTTTVLNSGDTASVFFSEDNSFIPSETGTYSLKFYTTLIDDTNHLNDTSTISVTVVDSSRDAGVVAAATVLETTYTGSSVSFNTFVKNFGVANLPFVPVCYKVEGDSIVTTINTGSIYSGDSASIIFSDSNSFFAAAAGNYVLRFFTNLSGDTNHLNDTVTFWLTVVDSSRDAGVTQVSHTVTEPIYSGTSIPFNAKIVNYGQAYLPSIPVSYVVTGDSAAVSLNSGPLNAGDTSFMLFTGSQSLTPVAPGEYILKFFTTLTGDTNYNNDTTTLLLTVIDSIGTTVLISMIPEGLYNYLRIALNLSDTVKAYLREIFFPYSIVDSAASPIDSLTFEGSFRFLNAPNRSYYLVVTHRNSIETWGNIHLVLTGPRFTQFTYDFTLDSTRALGNNLIRVSELPVKFGTYSGDVDQDGSIDVSDVIIVFNDGLNFVSGYVKSDIDGNLYVDVSDLLITYNNSYSFVSKITP